MAENPYPPDDFWRREMERRMDRMEQWRESVNFGRLEDKVTRVQSDVMDVKNELRGHIAEVKPLLASDASRTGISAWSRWLVGAALGLFVLVLNILVAAGALH